MKCNCKNRTGIKPNILSQTLVCALVWNMAHFIQLKITAAVIGGTLWNPNKYFRFQFMNVIYYTVTIQVSVSARFTPPPFKIFRFIQYKIKTFIIYCDVISGVFFLPILARILRPHSKYTDFFLKQSFKYRQCNSFLIATCF